MTTQPEKTTKWISLPDSGFVMTDLSTPADRWVIAWGVTQQADRKTLSALGFLENRENPRLMQMPFPTEKAQFVNFLKGIKKAFPAMQYEDMAVVKRVMPSPQAWKASQTKIPDFSLQSPAEWLKQQVKTLKIQLAQGVFLGENAQGEKVYRMPQGRVIRHVDGQVEVLNAMADPARFLRYDETAGPRQLVKVVEGAVNNIINGAQYHKDELVKLAEAAYDFNFEQVAARRGDAGYPFLKAVEEAISTGITLRIPLLLKNHERDSLYKQLDEAYERRPRVPVNLEAQAETLTELPPSVAQLMEKLVDANDSKRLYVPFTRSSTAEALLPQTLNIVAHCHPGYVDVMSSRQREMFPNIRFSDSNVSAAPGSMEAAYIHVPNYPEQSNYEVSYDNTLFRQKVFATAAEYLDSITDNGQALLVLPTLSDKTGIVSSEYQAFLSYVYDKYLVNDAYELDADVVKREGGVNYRMLHITGRNLDLVEQAVPQSLEVIDTIEQFRTLSEKLFSLNQDQAPLNVVDDADTSGLHSESQEELPDQAVVANEFQTKYSPLSKVGPSDMMIPRDLASQMRRALAQLKNDVGDVDQFVADALHYDVYELSGLFSPEQVDVIAMAINNEQKGTGIHNGGMTGVGKGRMLAAMVRYSLLNEQSVLFTTTKENLFNDLWRDLCDIKTEHLVKPYVINNNSTLVDGSGAAIDVGSHARNKNYMDTGNKPDAHNLFFATYNTIRSGKKMQPSIAYEFIMKALSQVRLIADESHEFCNPKAKTFEAMSSIRNKLVDKNQTVTASATIDRNGNEHAYTHLLPPNFDESTLHGSEDDLVRAFVRRMEAQDGTYWRYEHDLSNVPMSTLIDTDNRSKYIQAQDAYAKVTKLMAELNHQKKKSVFGKQNQPYVNNVLVNAGYRQHAAGNRLKKGDQSWQADSTIFTSRAYNNERLFNLVVKNDFAVNDLIKTLKDNKRPVVILEQTCGTFLKQYVEDMIQTAERVESGEVKVSDDVRSRLPQKIDGEWLFPEKPRFKDVLKYTVRDAMKVDIKVKKGRKKASVESFDITELMPAGPALDAVKEAVNELNNAIDSFPSEYSYDAIDHAREVLMEKAGLTVAELTGRERAMLPSEEHQGFYRYTNISADKSNRTKMIRDYQNGEYDVAIMNMSAAEGNSLHADPKFDDTRQRILKIWQYPKDVVKFLQLLGRINRKGQEINPEMNFIEADIPSNIKQLGMMTRLLEKVFVGISASKKNGVMPDSPISLNSVFGEVCADFCMSNPELVEQMALPELDMEARTKSVYKNIGTKVSNAIGNLDYLTQEKVWNELQRNYESRFNYLLAQGENPDEARHYNIKAKVVNKAQVLQPTDVRSRSKLMGGVDAWLLKYENKEKNIESRDIASLIKKYDDQCHNDLKEFHELDSLDALYEKAIENTKRRNESFLVKWADNNPNDEMFLKNKARNDTVLSLIEEYEPGVIFEVTDRDGGTQKGVVLGLEVAWHGKTKVLSSAHNTESAFRLILAEPGDVMEISYSLRELADAHLKGRFRYTGEIYSRGHAIDTEFDTADTFGLDEYRVVLTGNLLAAQAYAKKEKLGNMGTFTDELGDKHEAIICKKSLSWELVVNRGAEIHDVDTVTNYVGYLIGNSAIEGNSITLFDNANSTHVATRDVKLNVDIQGERVFVEYPANKTEGAAFNGENTDEWNEFLLRHGGVANKTGKNKTAEFELEHLPDLIEYIYSHGKNRFYTKSGDGQFIPQHGSGAYNDAFKHALANKGLLDDVDRPMAATM